MIMQSFEPRQKEVCWVSFFYSNSREQKHRPALVISNNDYNAKNEDVLACAVTSSIMPRPYSIELLEDSFSEGNLPLKSRVRCDKILSIEKSLFTKKICTVSKETFSIVVKEINGLISQK